MSAKQSQEAADVLIRDTTVTKSHHHQPEILYGGLSTALRYGRLQTRVRPMNRAITVPESTGGGGAIQAITGAVIYLV